MKNKSPSYPLKSHSSHRKISFKNSNNPVFRSLSMKQLKERPRDLPQTARFKAYSDSWYLRANRKKQKKNRKKFSQHSAVSALRSLIQSNPDGISCLSSSVLDRRTRIALLAGAAIQLDSRFVWIFLLTTSFVISRIRVLDEVTLISENSKPRVRNTISK